jgi:predicted GTPase
VEEKTPKKEKEEAVEERAEELASRINEILPPVRVM